MITMDETWEAGEVDIDMGPDPARSLARKEFDRVFAADMRGKSVLDVGTGEGAVCLEALRRGADRVVGVDIDDEALRRARARATSMGMAADFRCEDLDRWCPDDTFDYVVCGGALTRVRDPFSLLDRLIDLSNERLVLDIAGIAQQAAKELRLRWWHRLLLRGLRDVPLVFVNRLPLRQARQRYFLSSSAVLCLLREHRSAFYQVDLIPSARENRHLVVAEKRRIGRLIVIAGPTSSGKSTLIAALREGKAHAIADRLVITGQSDWESLNAHEIASDTRAELSTIVMHYDFLARLQRKVQASKHRTFLDVARCARELVVLTLWTEPQRLQQQFEQGEIHGYVSHRGAEPTNPKTLRLQRDYQDPRTVVDYYVRWLEFVSTLPGDHLVLSQLSQPQFFSIEQWLDQHGGSTARCHTSPLVRNGPV
jgi:SAM-dependent methyltransferase